MDRTTTLMNAQQGGNAEWGMELDPELGIGQVQALSRKLRSMLEARRPVSLDASRIEIIDACGLQLLAAFVRAAAALGITLGWSGVSEPLRNTAKLLDLERHLKLAEIRDQPVDSRLLPQVRGEREQTLHEQTAAREMVRILDLGIAQIDAALADSEGGIAALSGSFAGIAAGLKGMEQAVWEIPSDQAPAELMDTVESYRQAVAKSADEAVVGMQFYDQLVQRLSHVRNGLACLAKLVADRSRARIPAAWSDLMQIVRAMYSMAQERDLFDAAMKGEAPEGLTHKAAASMARSGEVEWFQRP